MNSDRRRGSVHVRGFSLIELMVTIAVAAIIASTALPYLGSFVNKGRARSVASELESALNYARAEAIARAHEVRVCALAAAGSTTCATVSSGTGGTGGAGGTTGGGWSNGWKVYDTAFPAEVIRLGAAVDSPMSITAGVRVGFGFSRDGLTVTDFAAGVGNGTIQFAYQDLAGQTVAVTCPGDEFGGRTHQVTASK